ncbi:MAG: hypothetical protein FJ220_03905, partial [Kiritimatiellaceae bacterium]|nr:hypothetical protein [Kiritimatiellaceae bacterium]
MSVRTSKSILIAVLLWIVILSGIAAALRYFVLPELREKKMARLAGQTGSEGRYKSTVRIALDGFSGYCVLRSTEFSDRLARAGIRVDVQDDGADYTARMKALRDGDVQMAVFPVNSFIQSGVELGEFPASIVYLIDETVGADAMVAFKSAVPTIQALNRDDARIVLTSGSPSELLARVMIASFNLPDLPDKKWLVSANGAEDVFNRFRGDTSGKPVAYALWEPYVSKAMKLPDAIVLLDSSKMKGFIVDVLVAERQFLIDHYDIAKEVVENYARAAYGVQGTMPELILADAKQNGEKISL